MFANLSYQQVLEKYAQTVTAVCVMRLKNWADTAGIYWWTGKTPCAQWPGYEAISTGFESEQGEVFYYDVPEDVPLLFGTTLL